MRYALVSAVVLFGAACADDMSAYLLTTIADGQPQAPMPMSTPYTTAALETTCTEEMPTIVAPTPSTIPVYTPPVVPTVAPVPTTSAVAPSPPVYGPSSSAAAAVPSSSVAIGPVASSSIATPAPVTPVTPAKPSGLLTVISDNQPQAPIPTSVANAPVYTQAVTPAYTPTSGFATGAIGGSATTSGPAIQTVNAGSKNAGGPFAGAALLIAGILLA